MRTLAIVGSRGTPAADLDYFLPLDVRGFDRVVSGGARGADIAGEEYAAAHGMSVVSYRPKQIPGGFVVDLFIDGFFSHTLGKPGTYYPTFGHAAKARNWWIARDCERLVAFWDGESTGTSHAIACAVRLNRDIRIHMAGDS